MQITLENAGSRVIGIASFALDMIIPNLPLTKWKCIGLTAHAMNDTNLKSMNAQQIRILPNTIFDGNFVFQIEPGENTDYVSLHSSLRSAAANTSQININYQIKLTSGETLRGTVG
ncbi:MAG: hypothetical protein R3C61_26610 [Bacteroidia bacterium]